MPIFTDHENILTSVTIMHNALGKRETQELTEVLKQQGSSLSDHLQVIEGILKKIQTILEDPNNPTHLKEEVNPDILDLDILDLNIQALMTCFEAVIPLITAHIQQQPDPVLECLLELINKGASELNPVDDDLEIINPEETTSESDFESVETTSPGLPYTPGFDQTQQTYERLSPQTLHCGYVLLTKTDDYQNNPVALLNTKLQSSAKVDLQNDSTVGLYKFDNGNLLTNPVVLEKEHDPASPTLQGVLKYIKTQYLDNTLAQESPIKKIIMPIAHRGRASSGQHFLTLQIDLQSSPKNVHIVDSLNGFRSWINWRQYQDFILNEIKENLLSSREEPLDLQEYFLNHQSYSSDLTSCGYFSLKLASMLLDNTPVNPDTLPQPSHPWFGIHSSQKLLTEEHKKYIYTAANNLKLSQEVYDANGYLCNPVLQPESCSSSLERASW